MTDEQMKVAPIAPVTVTLIGSGTGDGSPIPNNSMLRTPDHQPNIIVKVVTPLAAVLIRFVNAYATVWVGLVTVGLTTDELPAADFAHLAWKCAGLSLAGPIVSAVKDCITILGNLEKKYPIATGNV